MVTLNHVARAAGVSPSTVSRIVNGTAQVAPEKRDLVLAAIDQLGYRPNAIARGLAKGKSMSVGVLTQDIASAFYGAMLVGIEQGLHGSGYNPVFVSGHWEVSEEGAALDVLVSRGVDAVIVLGGHTPDERLLSVAERIPLVAVGRSIQGLEDRCLRVDNVRGAYLGTRHLIELGHRRIAFVAGRHSHRDARDRFEGYTRALEDAGIPHLPELVVQGDFSEQSGLMAMEGLFSRASLFSAVVCANDQSAYGARLALFRRGVRVPDDVSLVGFDDLPASTFSLPPLTTVRQPTYEMGLAAARYALCLLAGKPFTPPSFDVELVVRESTALNRHRLGTERMVAAMVDSS